MRVAVYSTNPSIYDAQTFFIGAKPSWFFQWNETAKKHQELDIFIVAAIPGLFLLDLGANSSSCAAKNLHIVPLENSQPENAAEKIASLAPDIAVAASSWTLSYDWLPLNDSITAHLLEKKGIWSVCNSAEFSMNCFNKYFTHQLLEKHGFLMPEYIYVNHEMYKADLKKASANFNAYREYVLSRLSDMSFPVVIKPVAGVSSLGIRIADTFAMAKAFLDSRKNGSDHIVEEYMPGVQMGLEIHGFPKIHGTPENHDFPLHPDSPENHNKNGNYTVFPPMEFSLNSYGITNPRQSTKKGPVSSAEKYPLAELYKEMERLAEILQFSGTLQIDLVYSREKWYILELNSRLSGMTSSYATAFGTTVPEMILQDAGIINGEYGNMKNVVSTKIPVQNMENIKELEKKAAQNPKTKSTIYFFNTAAEQEREKGYFEVIETDDF